MKKGREKFRNSNDTYMVIDDLKWRKVVFPLLGKRKRKQRKEKKSEAVRDCVWQRGKEKGIRRGKWEENVKRALLAFTNSSD